MIILFTFIAVDIIYINKYMSFLTQHFFLDRPVVLKNVLFGKFSPTAPITHAHVSDQNIWRYKENEIIYIPIEYVFWVL